MSTFLGNAFSGAFGTNFMKQHEKKLNNLQPTTTEIEQDLLGEAMQAHVFPSASLFSMG